MIKIPDWMIAIGGMGLAIGQVPIIAYITNSFNPPETISEPAPIVEHYTQPSLANIIAAREAVNRKKSTPELELSDIVEESPKPEPRIEIVGEKPKSTKKEKNNIQKVLADIYNTGRPPQVVLMGFDCGNDMPESWQRTLRFSEQLESKLPNDRFARFTYFVTGANLIEWGNRKSYTSPDDRKGRSNIGFAQKPEEVKSRINSIIKALKFGHEIGSHSVGHFDGKKWTQAQWKKEFIKFDAIMKEAFESAGNTYRLELKGFRAPYLSTNKALYSMLSEFGFTYDTSSTLDRTKWPMPDKHGIWHFNVPPIELAQAIDINEVLAMDYNFFMRDTKGKEIDNFLGYKKPTTEQEIEMQKKALAFEERMFQTYMNYFDEMYNGNRAPVTISHHLTPMNRGAYMSALERFAEKVCGQDEVMCITYSDYVDFLKNIPEWRIVELEKGVFAKPTKKYAENKTFQ